MAAELPVEDPLRFLESSDTISMISDIQFQICQKHKEEAKAFCTTCNCLLCVFCMIKDDDSDEDENNGT